MNEYFISAEARPPVNRNIAREAWAVAAVLDDIAKCQECTLTEGERDEPARTNHDGD